MSSDERQNEVARENGDHHEEIEGKKIRYQQKEDESSSDSPSSSSPSPFLPFERELHIGYFASALRGLPPPYAKLDSNRLTLVHFAVHALDLLGVWDDDVDNDDDDNDEETNDDDKNLSKKQVREKYNLDKYRILQWIQQYLYLQHDDDDDDISKNNDTRKKRGFQGGTYVGPMRQRTATATANAATTNSTLGEYCQDCDPEESVDGNGNINNNININTSGCRDTCCLNDYHQHHIAMTYTALCIYKALQDDVDDKTDNKNANDEQQTNGDENNNSTKNKPSCATFPPSFIDTKGIINSLKRMQRDDGSFSCTHHYDSEEHDMRFLYCACAISYLLNDWSAINVDLAVEYITNCKSYDGAIALLPGQEGHGGSTFCAVASLVLMNRLDDVILSTNWKHELIRWCISRQQSQPTPHAFLPSSSSDANDNNTTIYPVAGMQGRPNKVPDTCYSYWIGGTLYLLGYGHLLQQIPLRNFILTCQPTMVLKRQEVEIGIDKNDEEQEEEEQEKEGSDDLEEEEEEQQQQQTKKDKKKKVVKTMMTVQHNTSPMTVMTPQYFGGFAKIPTTVSDVLHSFYSLAWLSLSNKYEEEMDMKDTDYDEEKEFQKSDDIHTKIRRQEQQLRRRHFPLHALNCTLGIRQDRVTSLIHNNSNNIA